MTFEEIKTILSTKTVGIAGCGGLGSNCAVALARTGIGKLILVDFDVIKKIKSEPPILLYRSA